MVNNIVGERLRITREAQGLSVPELAEILGVTRRSIYYWENGTSSPKPNHLDRITKWYATLSSAKASEPDIVSNKESPLELKRKARQKLTPQVKREIADLLRIGRNYDEIQQELNVSCRSIAQVRHEAGIPVQSRDGKRADQIYNLWNSVREETGGFNPSRLGETEKMAFATGLLSVQLWLKDYITRNLADAIDVQKLNKEVKRVLNARLH